MRLKLKYWILVFAVGIVFLSGCVKQQEIEESAEQQPAKVEETQIAQPEQPAEQASQEVVAKYNSYKKLIYEKAEELRNFEQQPEETGVNPGVLEFENLLLEFKQFMLDNEAVLKDAGVDTAGALGMIEEQLTREKKEPVVQEKLVFPVPFDEENYSKTEVGLWPFCVHGGEHPEGHGGIDFELRPGTQIKAVADGEVEEIFSEEKGYNIFIGHGAAYTGYIPVLNPKVKKGDLVKKGQVLGTAGHDAKGNYFIHFEVNDFTKGGRVCPYAFFDDRTKKLVDEWLDAATYPEKTVEPYICNCEEPIPPS